MHNLSADSNADESTTLGPPSQENTQTSLLFDLLQKHIITGAYAGTIKSGLDVALMTWFVDYAPLDHSAQVLNSPLEGNWVQVSQDGFPLQGWVYIGECPCTGGRLYEPLMTAEGKPLSRKRTRTRLANGSSLFLETYRSSGSNARRPSADAQILSTVRVSD